MILKGFSRYQRVLLNNMVESTKNNFVLGGNAVERGKGKRVTEGKERKATAFFSRNLFPSKLQAKKPSVCLSVCHARAHFFCGLLNG